MMEYFLESRVWGYFDLNHDFLTLLGYLYIVKDILRRLD